MSFFLSREDLSHSHNLNFTFTMRLMRIVFSQESHFHENRRIVRFVGLLGFFSFHSNSRITLISGNPRIVAIRENLARGENFHNSRILPRSEKIKNPNNFTCNSSSHIILANPLGPSGASRRRELLRRRSRKRGGLRPPLLLVRGTLSCERARRERTLRVLSLLVLGFSP